MVKQEVDDQAPRMYVDETVDYGWIAGTNEANPGESYMSTKEDKFTAEDWEDVSEADINVRVKGFTVVQEEAVSGGIYFDRNTYEVVENDMVAADVLSGKKSVLAYSKADFSVEDESIAFVDSMGHIYGKKPGTTKVSVTIGKKTATADVVVEDDGITQITLTKKDDYGTEEKPIDVIAGSMQYPDFDINVPDYMKQIHFEVEYLGDYQSTYNDSCYEIDEYGFLIFYYEGLYKITAIIDDIDGYTGSSLDFYYNVGLDTVDCGNDISKLTADPYKNNCVTYYKYSDPDAPEHIFKLDTQIEMGCDMLVVLGMDEDMSFAKVNELMYALEGMPDDDCPIQVEDVISGNCEDYVLKTQYPYLMFVMKSDLYQDGFFEVKSCDRYDFPDSLEMNSADMTINLQTGGDDVPVNLRLLPKTASAADISFEIADDAVAEANYDEMAGKIEVSPIHVGETMLYLTVDAATYSDEAAGAEDADDEGIVRGKSLKVLVKVSPSADVPESFAFKEPSVELERNSTDYALEMNDPEWENYQLYFESKDPSICYVDADNKVTAVSCGETEIEAYIEGVDEQYFATMKVKVTEPSTTDIENMQTVHDYIQGMDEFYTYDAPEGTECINIYFDALSSLSWGDYLTISDGNGIYYRYDADGKCAETCKAKSESSLSDDFMLGDLTDLTEHPISIYGDKVVIHFVSGVYDEFVTSYEYGFKIKKVETGKAAKSLKIENPEMNLNFDTYNSPEEKIIVTKDPEDAIDCIYIDDYDNDLIRIDRDLLIKGICYGTTDYRVFTVNPFDDLEATGTVNIAEKKMDSVVFYESDGYGNKNKLIESDYEEVKLTPGEEVYYSYEKDPWDASQDIIFDYDEDEFRVDKAAGNYGIRAFAVSFDEEGEYDLSIMEPNDNKVVMKFKFIVKKEAPEVPEEMLEFDPDYYDVEGNGDIDPTELEADDIDSSDVDEDELGYWVYERKGADYIDITFSKLSNLNYDTDWIYIYDLDGQFLGMYTGGKDNTVEETAFAGKTIRVEDSGFILAFEKYYNYSAFEIKSIVPHFPEPAVSPEVSPEVSPTVSPDVSPAVSPEVSPAPAANVTPTKAASPTPAAAVTPAAEPKTGDVLKDETGKANYRILSSGTVALESPVSKTNKTFVVPAKVTLGGKSFDVVEISANAFKGNKKLTKITIGANVKSIKAGAFKGCSKLKNIIFKGTGLKAVGKNAIKGINKKAVIKAPKKAKKSYKKLFTKKTGWKTTMKVK